MSNTTECKCFCEKIKVRINCIKKNRTLSVMYFLSIAGSFLLFFGFLDQNLFTAAGSFYAATALVYTAYRFNEGRKEKKSKFYLQQVQRYFNKAADLLETAGNNSIKWHNAIRNIENAIELSSAITIEEHEVIFRSEYVDTAYRIQYVISKIDSFWVFYGAPNYKDKQLDTKTMFMESNKGISRMRSLDASPPDNGPDYKYFRISPVSLSFLCDFLLKVSHVEFLETSVQEKINYLKELPSKDLIEFPSAASSNFPLISDYIRDYQMHESKKHEYLQERKGIVSK